MKNRLTCVVIPSGTGRQRRFSIDKRLLYVLIVCILLLAASGTVGAWKYSENIELTQHKHQLETERQQMEAIAKTVTIIEQEEGAIHTLLGIQKQEPSGDSSADTQ